MKLNNSISIAFLLILSLTATDAFSGRNKRKPQKPKATLSEEQLNIRKTMLAHEKQLIAKMKGHFGAGQRDRDVLLTINFFIAQSVWALEQLQRPVTQEEFTRAYGTTHTLEDLESAKVLLLTQSHIDTNGIILNHRLMIPLFQRNPQILVESYQQSEEPNILTLLLGQIAFAHSFLKTGVNDYAGPEAEQLRAPYTTLAIVFVRHFQEGGVNLPLINVTARGWDAPNQPDDVRNQQLNSNILHYSEQDRQVIVHLGTMHAPEGYRRLNMQNAHLARTFDYDFYSEEVKTSLGLILPPPVYAVYLSIHVLRENLPSGSIELAPATSVSQTIQKPAKVSGPAQVCAVCHKKTTSLCGRCQKASYCSSKCQRSDWSNHKAHCTPKSSSQ